jgi:VIT1/CCC1 family predicted Fe2+/Mn2+ transporter
VRSRWQIPRGQLAFFMVTGLAEGILTALVLAAARMLEPDNAATVGLGLRVGLAAGLPEAVVFFAAEFSRLKSDLARMERQLNLTTHGQLAAGRLGRLAFEESLAAALVSSGCAFTGAAIPLILAAALPGPGWISIVASIVCLCALGWGIAQTLRACHVCWIAALGIAGALLALLGTWIKLV